MMTPPNFFSVSNLMNVVKSPNTLTYVLGLIGWTLIWYNMPFDWALPSYAEF